MIRGWDQGLENMCIGEKRVLTIPPHLPLGGQHAMPGSVGFASRPTPWALQCPRAAWSQGDPSLLQPTKGHKA